MLTKQHFANQHCRAANCICQLGVLLVGGAALEFLFLGGDGWAIISALIAGIACALIGCYIGGKT